jgi:hypothetical protein
MRFWKEKSVEDTVTLGPTARATLVYLKYNYKRLCKKIYVASVNHHTINS